MKCQPSLEESNNIDNLGITGIMACANNLVIGNKGQLPWRCQQDIDHFNKTTIGHVVVMGYKTFDSLPNQILANRFNIVFTTKDLFQLPSKHNIYFVNSLVEFQLLRSRLVAEHQNKCFMIGGTEIATLFLGARLIDNFMLTRLHQEYDGDKFFPIHLLNEWSRKELQHEKDFTIFHYKR